MKKCEKRMMTELCILKLMLFLEYFNLLSFPFFLLLG